MITLSFPASNNSNRRSSDEETNELLVRLHPLAMQRPAVVETLLLLLLVVAAQTPSFGAYASLITGFANLGEECYYDEECDTGTTFCRDRRVCDCKENFREAEGRCVATVGARCSSDYDCSSLESSVCEEHECVCREGYVRNADYYACLPVVMVFNGACQEDEQCRKGFGEQAVCKNDMCECLDGNHYADGACWRSKGLGQSCANASECSYAQDERFRVQCRDGQCRCRDGDREDDGVCKDGASQIALSMAAVLFVATRFSIS